MKTISAANANRHFSKVLREVRAGETVVVTSRGEPIARIEPSARANLEKARKDAAWKAYLARLESQPTLGIPITWTRDDVYDDDF